jgi:hypothetical protein
MHPRSDIQRHRFVIAVLAFVLAQWLAFAHEMQHAAGPQPDHECSLCVVALDLDTALPGVAMPSLPASPDIEAPRLSLPLHTLLRLAPLHRARAPPLHL